MWPRSGGVESRFLAWDLGLHCQNHMVLINKKIAALVISQKSCKAQITRGWSGVCRSYQDRISCG